MCGRDVFVPRASFSRLGCLTLIVAAVLRCDTGNPLDPDSNGTPPTETPTASIHGTVWIAGSAVGGAQIVLNGPGMTRAVTAEADGTFSFADLPSGVYIVEANLAGVACEKVTADIKAGETVDVGINCAAAQPHLIGTITGTVTVGSAPLGGVQVTVNGLPFTGAELSRAVMANSAGGFTFAGLAAGAYTVTAAGLGLSCISSIVGVQAGQTATTSISCTEDESGGGPPPPPMTGPTGKIAFERDGRVMVVAPDGGNAIAFIDGRAPSWSREGRKLVFQRPGCPDRSVPPFTDCDDVWMVNADGSGLSPITNSEYVHDHEPVWSPDGTKVAFIRFWHGPDQDYLVVVDANQPPALWSETVPSQWWPYARPTRSADGMRIAFTCQGPPPGWQFDICVVPANNHVGYFTNSTSDWSAGLVKLTNDTWINSDPAWSPDGTRIAFTTNRGATNGRSFIALISPNGSGFLRLVPGRRPAWSPDGSRIVFVGGADAPGIYVVNADGSGLARITDNPADTAPSWGP